MERTPMTYGLSSAATAGGINKSTVLRAIKSGKISASKDEFGNWVIDPAEFHRVYPVVQTATERDQAARQDATADALVAELRAVIADLRCDRDAWKEQAQRLALPKPAMTWWRWLRSTG
jgi:hypothetical protein